jgi:hypothetical protein
VFRAGIGAFYDASMPAVPALLAASLLAQSAGQAGAAAPPARDEFRVTLEAPDAGLLAGGGTAGRMIVFLAAEGALSTGTQPCDAPFFDAPQPMASVAVDRLVPGTAVVVGEGAAAFPGPLAALRGRFAVQAVFDRDRTERGHLGPGNLASQVTIVELDPARADAVELRLLRRLEAEPLPTAPNLRFVEVPSRILSEALGRPVTMRAGVALPPGWDDPNHRRRMFPAVYSVPGFGGTHRDAAGVARMLATPGSEAIVPQAVWIVLDPECPLGHHGFVDSAANGPRGRALVEELVPELERRFRLVRRPEARIVTGHSSGGWSAVWLQLSQAGTFGACFASSPDPVDFSRFQNSDLYRDLSVYTDAEGRERASYREPVVRQVDRTCMTVRDEAAMERVLGPARDSGEQWDSWSAMWSAVDPATRLPRPMFRADDGMIDRTVVESQWSRYDIARRVREDPDRTVAILRSRVRLVCGGRDGFFLERAVAGLRDAIDAAVAARASAGGPAYPAGPGYVEIVPDEDHGSMALKAGARWHAEMRAHLRAHGLD